LNRKVEPSPQEGPVRTLFDIYKVDLGGSAEWLGSVRSHRVALLEIGLAAVEAPGDYVIVNRHRRSNRTELRIECERPPCDRHHRRRVSH
jgi:hypothetical protein